jgi:hypothetical protein
MWSFVVGLQTNTVCIEVRLALLQKEYVAFVKAEATGKQTEVSSLKATLISSLWKTLSASAVRLYISE